jgi:hypothetical protein
MNEILENNEKVLREFFVGIASNNYYDGLSHQLYLDLNNNKIFIICEVSDNTWLQRDDGSLLLVAKVNGYSDIPEEEWYTEGCDLYDYGYQEWLENIELTVEDILANQEYEEWKELKETEMTFDN